MSTVLHDAYTNLSTQAAALYRALGRTAVAAVTPEMAAAMLGLARSDAEGLLEQLVTAHLADEVEGRYRQHDLVRLHAHGLERDVQGERAELDGLVAYLTAGLQAAELTLTPSHHGHLPTPDAEILPPDLRPRLADEASALAWCDQVKDEIPRVVHICVARGMHAQVVELVHLNWPVFLRLGTARIELLDLALDAARALQDEEAVAMFQTGRPSPLRAAERYDEALAAAAEAEAIYTRLVDQRGRSQALNAKAKTFRAMGRFEEAWALHERVRSLRTQAGYARGVGLTLLELGNVALDLVHLPVALEYYEEARRILIEQLSAAAREPDVYDGTIAAIGAARVRGLLGQSETALSELEAADASMRERGSRYGRGLAAEARGDVHARAGETSSALAAYRAALECYESTDPAGVARMRRIIGATAPAV